MRLLLTAAMSTLAAGSALAGEASISIDIPRLNVAEYHRPYVAFWLESEDGGKITNLAVWYDVKHKDGEGTKSGGSMKFVEQVNGSKREIVPVPTESTQKKGN